MPTYTGAEILIAELLRHGITTVSGIPGGSNLPIYDALGKSRIRHVLARHEQGAGFIAQGMARSTLEPAVCLVTSGPGATNALTAVADAYADSVPLITISGQVSSALLGTDAFQEIDMEGMAGCIAKHVFLPTTPEELAESVVEAFCLARSGRPGPVVIDVPKDVQQARCTMDSLPEPRMPRRVNEPPPALLQAAAALMARAERPVVYLGGGVNSPEAAEACERLATLWDAPVVLSLMALGTIDVDHPLLLGMLGMHGAQTTNQVLAEADVVLAIGTRFDDRAAGKAGTLCPDARVIHVDIDPSEHSKLHPAYLAIHGDACEVATALGSFLRANGDGCRTTRGAERVRAACRFDQNRLPAPDATDARGILSVVAEAFGPDAFIVTDVGQHQMRVAQSYPFRRPCRFLTSGGLGTMGFGIPAALGVAITHPEAHVVCFTGDGSLMMNVQELATLAEERASVTIIAFDNASLGLVGQQQDLFYDERRTACDYRRPTDLVAVARAFGIRAFDLESREPRSVLDNALESARAEHAGPVLIRVPVDAREHVLPMVPPGAANTAPIVSWEPARRSRVA